MFKRIAGKPNIQWFPVTVSTVFPLGCLAYWSSGQLIPADATSGDHAGILIGEITAADDDYAVERMIALDVPTPGELFELDVETGTFVVTDIGAQFDLVADGDAMDRSATSKLVVTVRGFVSASKAIVEINSMIGHKQIATT